MRRQLALENKRPDAFGKRRAARFPRQDARFAERLQSCSQPCNLRGLADTVAALECNKPASDHVGQNRPHSVLRHALSEPTARTCVKSLSSADIMAATRTTGGTANRARAAPSRLSPPSRRQKAAPAPAPPSNSSRAASQPGHRVGPAVSEARCR